MKCIACKTGDLAEGAIIATIEKDVAIIVLKDVPALVCTQCGKGVH